MPQGPAPTDLLILLAGAIDEHLKTHDCARVTNMPYIESPIALRWSIVGALHEQGFVSWQVVDGKMSTRRWTERETVRSGPPAGLSRAEQVRPSLWRHPVAWWRHGRCQGCFIDWFGLRHSIVSTCPVHRNLLDEAYAVDGKIRR